MPKQTMPAEERTRGRMKSVYNTQKLDADGWADWGIYTAHVVHGLIEEVASLRATLVAEGVDLGPERDPFET
ncbi:hypothetical protein RAS1_37020 [Phycisphaerae bacterium RAS1]|nr:hypothetical protein RAS1_37020 [Phycisphaerae bacterium RAS1]